MTQEMKVIEGNYLGQGHRFGIVLGRFNAFLTERLLEGAIDAFKRHGVNESQLTLVRVPGAYEIPLVAKKLVAQQKFAAVVALGAVIRGDTPHFDFVASEVSKGLAQIGLESGTPVVFGVLTTDTIEQAEIRSGAKGSNKGFEAAMTAMEMADLCSKLS